MQIVYNRARTICYVVKLQHFRDRAEVTIARLMTSSDEQLSRLTTISQTQEQLKAVADRTIEQLETGHAEIKRKLDQSCALVEKVKENQLDVIDGLKTINESVVFLLSVLNSVHAAVHAQLDLVRYVIGGVGVPAGHLFCSIAVVVLCPLLRVRRSVCCLMVVVILLDAAAQLKFDSGCGFARLVAVLLAVGLLASFVAWFTGIFISDRHPATAVPAPVDADLRGDLKRATEALERLTTAYLARQNAAACGSTAAGSAPRRQLQIIPENAPPPPVNAAGNDTVMPTSGDVSLNRAGAVPRAPSCSKSCGSLTTRKA